MAAGLGEMGKILTSGLNPYLFKTFQMPDLYLDFVTALG